MTTTYIGPLLELQICLIQVHRSITGCWRPDTLPKCYIFQIERLLKNETKQWKNNLVPRALLPASKAREKRPGDEVDGLVLVVFFLTSLDPSGPFLILDHEWKKKQQQQQHSDNSKNNKGQ